MKGRKRNSTLTWALPQKHWQKGNKISPVSLSCPEQPLLPKLSASNLSGSLLALDQKTTRPEDYQVQWKLHPGKHESYCNLRQLVISTSNLVLKVAQYGFKLIFPRSTGERQELKQAHSAWQGPTCQLISIMPWKCLCVEYPCSCSTCHSFRPFHKIYWTTIAPSVLYFLFPAISNH